MGVFSLEPWKAPCTRKEKCSINSRVELWTSVHCMNFLDSYKTLDTAATSKVAKYVTSIRHFIRPEIELPDIMPRFFLAVFGNITLYET